ncbi:MAG: NADP-dependent malic enzyme [Selenomonadaceae bacterium]|nr:NADP-dependent malic enzyme [Selenomonadaceae bacterium]
MVVHKENNGKLATIGKAKLTDAHDLAILYTPGVAEPCRAIEKEEDLSFELTMRGNCVAVISDGTRVLGLGNIGAAAAMPVMEGKSILYKTFGDIDSVPVCLDTQDKDEFIKTVKILQKNYAGINLEDIQSPKCYDIEDALKAELDIPVFHDDQHGTAIICAAAVLGALRYVKKDIGEVKVVLSGAGAAGTAICRLLLDLGVKNMIMLNSKGAMYEGMDMSRVNRVQAELLKRTNPDKIKGDLAECAKGADVLLGVSSAGLFTPEIIKSMNKDAIVFAMANPVPETSYQAAKEAGAAVAGTGRSDAPNQVNNVSVFPGIFRGALDVRARAINEEMKQAAARAVASIISDEELRDDYVVPPVFDERVAPAVAAAVAQAAMDTGVARIKVDPEVIRQRTLERIRKNHANAAKVLE